MLREKQSSIYDLAMGRPLEINLLRTFVMLVEEQSVTRVARRLNRTQPAISLQLGRLNDAVGRPLFERDLRHPRLTRHGEMLLPYARQMLKMHDDAYSRLSSEEIAGRVTLGCPDLYAAFLLPETLASFRAAYPGIEVTVRCALSAQLSEEISAGRLDVALATRMPTVHPNVSSITLLRHEPLVWLGAKSGRAFQEKPLPLALLPEGNLYRDYALQALNNASRAWRIASVSESIAGMEAMALADAAVIVLAESVKVAGLRRLTEQDGMPPLPPVELVLWRRKTGAFPAADHLAAHIERDVGTNPARRRQAKLAEAL
ncbi:LysR substrate-binding domain-containing protein [Bradyrhizobium sp. 31Argb]|uniref:LysR substrate-binding domain-containing protein n=1 Tax=Bradyrhizobium sp. 31Argb TaxID=3141247 RepID=UPI00374A7987